MSKYEKLILMLIALVLLRRFGGFARDIYLAQSYGATVPLVGRKGDRCNGADLSA